MSESTIESKLFEDNSDDLLLIDIKIICDRFETSSIDSNDSDVILPKP